MSAKLDETSNEATRVKSQCQASCLRVKIFAAKVGQHHVLVVPLTYVLRDAGCLPRLEQHVGAIVLAHGAVASIGRILR